MTTPTGPFTGRTTRDRLEIEDKIRDVERRILANVQPGVGGVTNDPIVADSSVPQVTGVRLVPNVGTLTLEWSPVSTPPIRFYSVEIATDFEFSELVTERRTTDPQFTYQAAQAGTRYYVRVRAVSQGFGAGPPSAVLDTQSGLITSAELEVGAVTDLRQFQQVGGFDPLLIDFSTSFVEATYGPAVVQSVEFGTVLTYATATFEVQVDVGALGTDLTIDVEFIRDGDVVIDAVPITVPGEVGDYDTNPNEMSGDRLFVSATGLGKPDNPPPGDHEYTLRVTGTSLDNLNSRMKFRPEALVISTIEFRR